MAKTLLNVVPLNGAELPFLRRGGGGSGSEGGSGGGSYNVESVDNGDGTQTLAITDATSGGASGSSESPFFYVKWNYPTKADLSMFMIESISTGCIGIVNNQIFIGELINTVDIPDSGEVICKCMVYTMVINMDGQIIKEEISAEALKQNPNYSDVQIITEAEWNAEYNRILNL